MNKTVSAPDLKNRIDDNSQYSLIFDQINFDNIDFYKSGNHLGQFSAYSKTVGNIFEAVRDPLGINKLFYTETESGEIIFASEFTDLFIHKTPIFSVPAGKLVRIGKGGLRETVHSLNIPEADYSDFNIDAFKTVFTKRLESVFTTIKSLEDTGWTVFVALSGGLDSTIIASSASKYLSNPIACTLDLGKSEDSEKSIKIASHIGIKHMTFKTSEAQILESLKDAPWMCQDFRDFNVHCAALNILLAKNIREYVDGVAEIDKNKMIILTGDLMNEFTCDYAGEVIDGVEYYKLPRIGKKELQSYLIGGLDTSDRELSPFRYYGLKCIQPYAAVYDLYNSVPEDILTTEDPKKLLNSFLVDETILSFIPKVKLRAQVGSRENMGILGLCHKMGFNDKTYKGDLIERAGKGDGQIPIFVGRYDVEKFS